MPGWDHLAATHHKTKKKLGGVGGGKWGMVNIGKWKMEPMEDVELSKNHRSVWGFFETVLRILWAPAPWRTTSLPRACRSTQAALACQNRSETVHWHMLIKHFILHRNNKYNTSVSVLFGIDFFSPTWKTPNWAFKKLLVRWAPCTEDQALHNRMQILQPCGH